MLEKGDQSGDFVPGLVFEFLEGAAFRRSGTMPTADLAVSLLDSPQSGHLKGRTMIDPTGIEPLDRQRGRRAFMAALAGGFLSAPQFAKAQQGERIARVGILYFGPSLSLEEQERRAR